MAAVMDVMGRAVAESPTLLSQMDAHTPSAKPEDVASAVIAELFGDDEGQDELAQANRRRQVLGDLRVTSGDLTLGEFDVRREAVSLEGFGKDLELYSTHELVKSILSGGTEVRDHAVDVEARLRQVELESVEDYMAESENLVALHYQIRDCDHILEAMETLLGGFQADLGNISSEIKNLQDQSLSMSIKLRNRKSTAARLTNFIDELVVPPELIECIMDEPVSEDYVEHLVSLNKKLNFVKENSFALESAARRDVEPILERLRGKAVAKVRDFLMQRFYGLRKPKTNIQILQQNVLLKYKYFATFLQAHGSEVFPEVRGAYVETMNKILSAHFKTYIGALIKLQMDIATKNDLVGVDESKASGLFSRSRDAFKNRTTVFSLGERINVLKDADAPAIIPHAAEQQGSKFPYEMLFRSINKLLMDTATSEYLFCNDFFGSDTVFKDLFSGPLAVVEEHVQSVLPTFHDAIGLLLMIRLNKANLITMQKRRIPVLESYMDKINILIWPRFKAVFEMHYQSIQNANAKRLWSHDIHAHYVTRRYAEFTSSLLQLNVDYGDAQMDYNLDRLRVAMDDLLVKLSQFFPIRKDQIIFLINNYDVILSVFKESGSEGMGTHQQYLEDLLRSHTTLFVEEQLTLHFGSLISFVKKAEAVLKQPDGSLAINSEGAGAALVAAGYTPEKAEPLLKGFASTWKMAIESMHRDTMTYFSNFICGMEILKAILTQLLLYYTRFLEITKRAGGGNAVGKDAVSIPSIMYEIKKYSRTF